MTALATAGRSRPPQKKQKESARDWYEVVASYAGNIAKVCVAAFVVALGYIIYGVYGGYLDSNVDARKLGNIVLMGKVLCAAGILGTLAFIVAMAHEVAYGVAAGIVGLALIFGTPMLLITKLQSPDSPAGVAIQEWTFRAGLGICVLALLRVVYQIGHMLKTGPKSREKALRDEEERLGPKKVKRVQGVYSRCWDLPYCHDTIRDVCPAYKDRKNCWRMKRGCNCDPMMVETMIQAGAARMGKGQDKVGAKKQQTADDYMRDAVGAGKGAKGTPSGRTISCKKCPIYGEHQRQKFKIVNPIALVLTIVGLVLCYPILNEAYKGTVQWMANTAAEFTMGNQIDPGKWFAYLDTPTVQVFFFAIVSLFLVSYVLKFVEWAVFVKKI